MNLLLTGQLCKISDFGESRLVATSGQGRENLANPLWLAPEVFIIDSKQQESVFILFTGNAGW
jgi:hypothetical protein